MWTLRQPSATCAGEQVQASFNPYAPWQGIRWNLVAEAETWQDDARSNRDATAQIEFEAWRSVRPAVMVDLFLRGEDLIATYEQDAGDELRCQIRWRTIRIHHRGFGIDVLLSVQTNLLHSLPSARIGSTLSASELLVGNGGHVFRRWSPGETPQQGDVVLMRFSGGASYVEIPHPQDLNLAGGPSPPQISRLVSGHYQTGISLFAGPLERGVIRRARFRSLWVPRDEDEMYAQLAWSDLMETELPLTT